MLPEHNPSHYFIIPIPSYFLKWHKTLYRKRHDAGGGVVGERDNVNSCTGFWLLGVVTVRIWWGGATTTTSNQEANLQLRNKWVGQKGKYLKLKHDAQDSFESRFKVKVTNVSWNWKNHTINIRGFQQTYSGFSLKGQWISDNFFSRGTGEGRKHDWHLSRTKNKPLNSLDILFISFLFFNLFLFLKIVLL